MNLEADLSTANRNSNELSEDESQIKYIAPSQDEIKKYIANEEKKMHTKVDLRDDSDFSSIDFVRENSLRNIAPQDDFLRKQLDPSKTDFNDFYDIEKDYIHGETGEIKVKRKLPWER